MPNRRILLGGLAAVLCLAGAEVRAGGPTPYTPAAFEAALKSGKPVLVHVTAIWCTTCAAQKPILARLEAEPRFEELRVFDVDFDGQKAAMRRFRATMQSTLIVYRAGEEVARASGITDPGAITALLAKAI